MAEQGIFDGIGMQPYNEVSRQLNNVPIRSWFRERIPIVAAATAQDMAMIFPAGSIIHKVVIDAKVVEATGTTKTVDVGISGGDENGFIDGLSVATTAGVRQPTLADGAATLGVLLSEDESSGDLVPEDYVCAAATTLCYTLGSDDFEELEAYVLVEATVFPE
jgi:hypothetical protein